MPVIVSIPAPLRLYAGHANALEVEGVTVGQALGRITAQFPELKRHLYGRTGSLAVS